VHWDGRNIEIQADNASLRQILQEIGLVTGVEVAGFEADQRVFGAYGPGRLDDVLLTLLDGSGYNVLISGNRGVGIPRQVQLYPCHAPVRRDEQPQMTKSEDATTDDPDSPFSANYEPRMRDPDPNQNQVPAGPGSLAWDRKILMEKEARIAAEGAPDASAE
jgi:hypothetical protein